MQPNLAIARTAIFIDNAYLLNVQQQFGYRRVNLQVLADKIHRHMENCGSYPLDLLRVYFYDCINEEKSGQRDFIATVRSWSGWQVRLGELGKVTCNSCNAVRSKQKRVDSLLTIDVVSLSLKHMITHAAIVAGDSDFIPAVNLACEEGVSIWLFHGDEHSCHRELRQSVDKAVLLTPQFLIPYENKSNHST